MIASSSTPVRPPQQIRSGGSVTDQQVDDSCATEGGLSKYGAWWVCRDSADDRGLFAKRASPHRGKCPLRFVAFHDGTRPTLITRRTPLTFHPGQVRLCAEGRCGPWQGCCRWWLSTGAGTGRCTRANPDMRPLKIVILWSSRLA
ncbi:MAG TPA: hypothetical protein VLW50_29315 [Streptosporangiaceae bacterium]|nr:hypothetical protein [Streptosporangiaceae bacterium]